MSSLLYDLIHFILSTISSLKYIITSGDSLVSSATTYNYIYIKKNKALQSILYTITINHTPSLGSHNNITITGWLLDYTYNLYIHNTNWHTL